MPQVYWSAESAWYALALGAGDPYAAVRRSRPATHSPWSHVGEVLTVFILMLDVPLT